MATQDKRSNLTQADADARAAGARAHQEAAQRDSLREKVVTACLSNTTGFDVTLQFQSGAGAWHSATIAAGRTIFISTPYNGDAVLPPLGVYYGGYQTGVEHRYTVQQTVAPVPVVCGGTVNTYDFARQNDDLLLLAHSR